MEYRLLILGIASLEYLPRLLYHLCFISFVGHPSRRQVMMVLVTLHCQMTSARRHFHRACRLLLHIFLRQQLNVRRSLALLGKRQE